MIGWTRRRWRVGLGFGIAALGFGGAAILDNTLLALVGVSGLLAAVLGLDRIPRSRD